MKNSDNHISYLVLERNKKTLLIDLCPRLAHGVIIHIHDINVDDYDRQLIGEDLDLIKLNKISCKPYLRSMPNMTNKERIEWHEITFGQRWITFDNIKKCIDWLNAHHFDYRGLIPMGLALEAPKDMYK